METITIRQVARSAGVSVKTVSRVINSEPGVRHTTRDRVQQVIADLGFRPNPLARSLVAMRTSSLGLVVPEISNPFFPPLVYGCLAVAEREGYHLVVDTGGSRDIEMKHLYGLLDQRVAGIILWASVLSESEIQEVMDYAVPRCPMVFIDCAFDSALKPSINLQPSRLGNSGVGPLAAKYLRTEEHPHAAHALADGIGVRPQSSWRSFRLANRKVGVLATEHLLSEGRRRVAHLAAGDMGGLERREGYLQALSAAGCSPEDHWVRDGTIGTIQAGAIATLALFERRPYPDSIFAFNDATAVGALLACRRQKMLVPDDIAIVGVDDTQMAAVTDPPLTTIRLHQRQTGELAASLLLDMIAERGHKEAADIGVNLGVVGPAPELVGRRSSTPRVSPDVWLDDLPLAHG